MKILWLTWKDRSNPLAGGAEVLTDALCARAAAAGHEVIMLTAGYPDCQPESTYNGYKIIRVGGRWSVYYQAAQYYKQNLLGWADMVVEEINTMPFFSQFYAKTKKRYLFVHQLCREIWFYQMSLPLSVIGYIAEPIYLWMLRNNRVITVSKSTENDLARFGFKHSRMQIISEGILLQPARLADVKKYPQPTMLSLGSLRAMKRTIHQVQAFELAKERIPNLQLVVVGGPDGSYGARVLDLIKRSRFADSIEYKGWVTESEKQDIMRSSHVIGVTSVKEGWGMIVTEANSQGTPAVVYNVDGLRDSADLGKVNIVTKSNTPQGLAEGIVELLSDSKIYTDYQAKAHRAAEKVTFEQAYADFAAATGISAL